MGHPIWFDTDPGIDDAIAILLAACENPADLVGFSSVAGNVGEDKTSANLVRLLKAMKEAMPAAPLHPKIVRGADRALLREPRDAAEVHGNDGLGGSLPPEEPPVRGLPGYQALLDLAPAGQEFTGTLLAIGPLTNVALACLCDRTWAPRIRRLVIMGGSIAAGGNSTAASEFNFWADPEAARIVFEAGFPQIDLMPIDAGTHLTFGVPEWERFGRLTSPQGALARRLMASWEERVRTEGEIIYDSTAWVAVHHPEVFTWQPMRVTVDTAGGAADGASFGDRRPWGEKPNCRVAMEGNAKLYWDIVFRLLGEKAE